MLRFWGHTGLSLFLILTVGCLRVAPKMAKSLASPSIVAYSSSDLNADVASYRVSVASSSLDTAKAQRNQIAFRVMAQVDAAYGSFELELASTRAGAQTAGDAAQLGLTAAATVIGGSDIKAILAATSTAFQGARISFDKNFFEQKTTEALISQMRASRKTLKTQLLSSLSTRDVASYPIEASWTDLVAYYYAGTIPSALVDIASKAGADAAKADQSLKDKVAELTPDTPKQAQHAIGVRAEYQRLKTEISSTSPSTVAAATETLHSILNAAHISFDVSDPPVELLHDLQKAMMDAANDPAKADDLYNAIQLVTQP